MPNRVFAVFIGLLLLLSGPVLAQTGGQDTGKALPFSRGQVELSFAPVVKQVAPAVVNIFSKRVVRQRAVSPLFNDP
ncbi:MAG: serine protease, partial [Alphaproteobacteria bacterium]